MLEEKIIKTLTNRYFNSFGRKDLEDLSLLYTSDVILNEWNENVYTGKEAVLKINKDAFDKFEKIIVRIVKQGLFDNGSMNEIEVILENADGTIFKVPVIDVIQFDDKGFLKSVIAYRGF
jgi:hypothetical protein